MNKSKYLDNILYLLFFIFFLSLACAFRAITSISIPLLIIAGVAKNKIDQGSFFSPTLNNKFLLSCCIFYILQIVLILVSNNHETLARHALLKSAIVFVPLSLCCCKYLNETIYEKGMKHFVYILTIVMIFCIATAMYKYFFLHAKASVFFYHELVSPFKQHAIQVSILLFIAFVHLLEKAGKGIFIYNKIIGFIFILFITGCILLLSSKLVIIFLVISSLYYIWQFAKKGTSKIVAFTSLFAGLAFTIIVLATNNMISKRFQEIINTDLHLIEQKSFDPGIYFDGLQFRLLQWRFVKEILNEKNAWLTGVSDDGQMLLDEKYIATRMYLGDGKSTDHGYLGYNTHNQFFQSLLQSGILGLAAFTFMCLAMIQLAMKRKRRELTFLVAILFAYSLNESMLERQYSITIFTFFPLFMYFSLGNRGMSIIQEAY